MINQTEQTLYRLSNLDAQQTRISYQMSTGKKLQQGSDDSVLYAREIYVDNKIRVHEGLKTQIERTTAQNTVSDSSVGEIKKLLEFVKTELIKANTSTTSDEGLKAIAVSISGVKENLFDLANTQVEGEYLFSGSDSSVQAFSKNSDGSISYNGDNKLRKVIVDEGSYRERGINGYDMMMYSSSIATKGETLTFSSEDQIFDQDGYEWKLNLPTNNTLTKYDFDGTILTDTLSVTNDALTPPTYSAIVPSTDGTKFEAKTNIFNVLDKIINSLNKVDNLGNPISNDIAKAGISKGLDDISDAFDGVNVAHAELGGRNKIFEISLEKVSSKLTQYNILSQEIGAADLSKVAMEAKALELTYTALYSTISKTNQLSLVNFLN
jgi:flagellar hook-associated protein 3 FlgL